jgi:Cytochrome oxidase complex assembly protein 1
MDPAPPNNIQPQRTNWWGRNWKWFVPTGCLGILLLVAGFIFVIVTIVFGAMKSSDAYKAALARAKADPRVVTTLGSPITDGFFVSGKTNVSGTSGQADMTIPISGPKGKGTVYFVASKFAGKWTFSKLMVEVADTGQRIDLIEDPATTSP